MSSINQRIKKIISGEDISIQELFKPLYVLRGRLRLLLLYLFFPVFIFGILGYIAKRTSPKEYEAKCVLLTDQATGSQATGSLMALAMLAGGPGAAGNNTSSDGSDLYQLILSNRPFLIELSQKTIYLPDQNKSITLGRYFKKELPVDAVTAFIKSVQTFPSSILGSKSNIATVEDSTDILSKVKTAIDSANASFSTKVYVSELNNNQKAIISILASRIKLIQVGKLITLTVKMPEARLSAEVTKAVLNLLIEYATRFKVGKQLENVRFLEERTAEAVIKYKESQQKVAAFKDNNYNVIFESVQTKGKELENDFVLYSGIYNQLIGQLEQAKIQLKKDTPLFTVVEPVYIPEENAVNNSILFSYISQGFVIGLILTILFIVRILRRSSFTERNEQNSQSL
jgi:hypothetical protein